ncbi:MAG: hypothetical protein V4760_19645 [Bdellovibrionota bacterium]
MRLVFSVLFALLSLIPILSFADSRDLGKSRVAVKFEECSSGTLRIELNVAGRTPKADLVEALKLFSDYPALLFTPTHAERTSVAYTAATRFYCETAKCARDAGFNEIQIRLARFKGVRLTCSPDELPAPGEQPKQDEPTRDDGGVTSGN